jgi:hypothetical protein
MVVFLSWFFPRRRCPTQHSLALGCRYREILANVTLTLAEPLLAQIAFDEFTSVNGRWRENAAGLDLSPT